MYGIRLQKDQEKHRGLAIGVIPVVPKQVDPENTLWAVLSGMAVMLVFLSCFAGAAFRSPGGTVSRPIDFVSIGGS